MNERMNEQVNTCMNSQFVPEGHSRPLARVSLNYSCGEQIIISCGHGSSSKRYKQTEHIERKVLRHGTNK